MTTMTPTINLSANIENGFAGSMQYIVTPNAKQSIATIINDYKTGIHSFTIIGSYGTGKSSFLLALESDLIKNNKKPLLLNHTNLSSAKGYNIVNVVGDYEDLSVLLKKALCVEESKNSVVDELKHYYNECQKRGEFLVLVIDEFGKILEHAAKNNPEKELYLLQKIAEFVNSPNRQILLLTTLHQNFSAYAKGLTKEQVNEWTKVKGRFKEITFVEPIEQILLLATKQYGKSRNESLPNIDVIHKLAIETKFITTDFSIQTAKQIYPLDPFSAFVIASAIRRYGQNERSLFTFLASRGSGTFGDFSPEEDFTYNLSLVYDYIVYNFQSYIRDANADTMSWSAMQVAVERVEGHDWIDHRQMLSAINIVKAIGLLNLFGVAGFRLNENQLSQYVKNSMRINDAEEIIRLLKDKKIIRYASYKERLVLFEGTDVDLESEIREASLVVPKPIAFVDELSVFINKRISPVKAHFYQKGTPRYFDYKVLDTPLIIIPLGDTDGYIELIFSTSKSALADIKKVSRESDNALIFAYFKNTDEIVEHLYNIKKYDYLLERVLDKNDRVAVNEIKHLKEYEENLLNKAISDNLFSYKDRVVWIFKGEVQKVESQRDFNRLLSKVCDIVYPLTPVMSNELFNKHKLSGTISAARKNYLVQLVEHGDEEDLGFPKDKFPPEKTIYYSLLKHTGLHEKGEFSDEPTNEDFMTVWNACEDFLTTTDNKPRKISDLIKILSNQPYKLKQGLLDFWIPTYLFIRRQEYALYNASNGSFIPNVNMEFFDLLQKHPSEYEVKRFAVDGVKLSFFNQYRKFVNLGDEFTITNSSFIETIKPFLNFYLRLNDYTKHTKKFDHKSTLRFRDVLAKAKDPEKTFFEDLPEALGFDKIQLKQEESINEYSSIIQRAVRELRNCYSQLIDRLEQHLVEGLNLNSYEYGEYVVEIRERLGNIKTHLLTEKQREFYQHATTEYDNRVQWYQSICYTVLEHRLDTLRDEQEEKLADDLVYLFRECEKYADISRLTGYNEKGIAYSFDLVSNKGTNVRAATFILPEKERSKVSKLQKDIEKIMTGDNNIDVCILLELLNKRMKK